MRRTVSLVPFALYPKAQGHMLVELRSLPGHTPHPSPSAFPMSLGVYQASTLMPFAGSWRHNSGQLSPSNLAPAIMFPSLEILLSFMAQMHMERGWLGLGQATCPPSASVLTYVRGRSVVDGP